MGDKKTFKETAGIRHLRILGIWDQSVGILKKSNNQQSDFGISWMLVY